MRTPIEEACGGSQPGQGHAAVGNPKKLPGLVERRLEVRRLLTEFKASERRVCELMAMPRSSGRYRSRRDDSLVQEQLRELARQHPRFDNHRFHLYLHREMGVNQKKVQRVYRELGLTVKRTRRKHLRRTLQPRPVLTAPNQEWALDFASDITAGGQRIHTLGVIESFTRQCLALDVDPASPAGTSPACSNERSKRTESRNRFAAITGPNEPLVIIWHGPLIGRSICCISSRASRRRTPERRYAELQRKAARRVPQHKLVLESVRRQEEDSGLKDGNITRVARTVRLPTEPQTSSQASGRLLFFQKRRVWPRSNPVKATLTGSASLRP
jgi:hypothetical protein